VDTVFNYPTLAECYKAAAFNGLNNWQGLARLGKESRVRISTPKMAGARCADSWCAGHEHIAVGLVEGHKVVGPLNIYPEKSQMLDPLQSMPAEGIVDCIRRQVEKVAGGEKSKPWNRLSRNHSKRCRGGSPNFHQPRDFHCKRLCPPR